MAFATDAQRRWFFAHLSTGMRRIAGKMKEAESYQKELVSSPDYQAGMMRAGMNRIGAKMAEDAGVKPTVKKYWRQGKQYSITYAANVRAPKRIQRRVTVPPSNNY